MTELPLSGLELTLVLLAVATLALPALGFRWGLPAFHLVARWTRWLLFGLMVAYLIDSFNWSYRPAWVHFATGLGIWFFLETAYYWLAIKALSRSELPLFPSFSENRDGDEWPAEPRCLRIREWLRKQEYRRLIALKASLIDEVVLRASIYESADGRHRIQILFIPNRRGGTSLSFSVSSVSGDGERMITDNQFLPFGGYFPDNWSVERRPLTGSLPRLVAAHLRRLERRGFAAVNCTDDPLHEINAQQRVLEVTNLRSGFLVAANDDEGSDRISLEGRYRLWKEMWCLAYIGRAVRG